MREIKRALAAVADSGLADKDIDSAAVFLLIILHAMAASRAKGGEQ
ncbi:hypothetical protein [Microvirga alba]|uniref:Uncharacterized protein n=1 Tax=Microvirga alba TaxID=2791025 RepID=A0A931BNA4_9HYPH|nr:hypothetical protein [Microvirga alba]MBF9233966.1 hypothetical protein [Microvirga alba]